MDRLLAAHEPFPGLVVDAHAWVIAANRASAALLGGGTGWWAALDDEPVVGLTVLHRASGYHGL
jgi:hypothetical protein